MTVLEDQISKFGEDGYLIVEDVFDPEVDFAQMRRDWQEILDGIAGDLFAAGKISSRYESLPFEQRILAVSRESGQNFPRNFDIALPQKNIQADTPIYVGPGIFDVLTKPALLDAIESLIGPEILCNPVGHVRIKLPGAALSEAGKASGLVGSVPFHQDQGVLLPEADTSEVISCWVAVNDVDLENGCLQVMPGSQSSSLIEHCADEDFRGTRGIPGSLLPSIEARPLPMRAGSVLFFPRSLVHAGVDNTSADRVRISLDLRYQPIGQPTGRPAFPGFVARSREHPEAVLESARAWAELWHETRDRLAREGTPFFNRWSKDSSLCA